jgi:type III secretion protein S
MQDILPLFQKGMLMVVWLSMPPLVMAVIAGVLISLVQTVLSIQDQAMPFAVKLLAVGLTLALMGRWIGVELLTLGEQAFSSIATINHRGGLR